MKTIHCEECGGKNMVELDLLSNIANQPDNNFSQTSRLRLAGGLYATKEYNNAISVVSSTIRAAENKQEIEIFLGLCQLHNGNIQQAETYFETVSTDDWITNDLLNACNQYGVS